MRRKILSLCLPLLIGAPNLAPIAVQADRAAALAAILPDDCPEYTDVTEDLVDMGVNLDLYPALSEGDVQCLSLVEWGYTGEETAPLGFGLYLYLYDPMERDWATSGMAYVAFADTAETFYDNSFHGLRMTRIDRSGDGRFTKWRIDDASAAYLKLNPSVRKYLVGSCSLRTKSGTDLSYPLGVEFDWSGFPRSESNTNSTLSMEKTPFQAVRAEVQPFTSDIGGITGTQTRTGWQFLNDLPLRRQPLLRGLLPAEVVPGLRGTVFRALRVLEVQDGLDHVLQQPGRLRGDEEVRRQGLHVALPLRHGRHRIRGGR